MRTAVRVPLGLTALGAATFAYGSVIERNAFTVRRFTVPVLDPGTPSLRVLHVSDLHISPQQRRKQEWVAGLAALEPDLVVNTGDTFTAAAAIPAVLDCLRPLARFPAVFVPGNNDYYQPRFSLPIRYFLPDKPRRRGPRLPWEKLADDLVAQGWTDLTHRRETLDVSGVAVALTGLDDPHLKRAHYDLVEGAAASGAAVRLGVMHSPEPRLLTRFAADKYDLVLAGHTHGGQVRVPFGPAIVTNSGIDVHRARWLHQWDEHMWFHVCAGLGTNPYMPVRFACRPEASLLTLVPRDTV